MFKEKYIKYKKKYLTLKKLVAGAEAAAGATEAKEAAEETIVQKLIENINAIPEEKLTKKDHIIKVIMTHEAQLNLLPDSRSPAYGKAAATNRQLLAEIIKNVEIADTKNLIDKTFIDAGVLLVGIVNMYST